MKSGKIDVTKIKKEWLFASQKGAKYLDITLLENKNGPDDYGNDGFIVQSPPREEREKGTKGPIIGNWKRIQPKGKPAEKPKPTPEAKDDGDDVPF